MTRTATGVGLLVALLLTILAGGWPSPARADGDPASDVLANQTLFLPADAGIPPREQLRLVALLDAARRSGLPIRVAIIARPSDMGAVGALWDQPHAYVRFLGSELSLSSRDLLLVVMPNGVGFYSPGRSATASHALVGQISSGQSGSALVSATEAAVMSLAKAAHVRLVPPGRAAGTRLHAPTPWRPTTDPVFGLAVLAALAALGAWLVASPRGRSAVRTLIPRMRRRM